MAPHRAVLADLCIMNDKTFTYMSVIATHATTSWIDPVGINHNLLCAITYMSVDNGLISPYHIPVSFSLAADVVYTTPTNRTNEDCNLNIIVSNWEACSSSDLSNYAS